MPIHEHTISDKEKAEMLDRLQRSAFRSAISKAEFVKLLSAMLEATEKDIESCTLSKDGRKVLIKRSNSDMWVNVEGDNNFALALDVITALDNS
jgi:CRISPR/Cas system-associated endoribonuclease Cas2